MYDTYGNNILNRSYNTIRFMLNKLNKKSINLQHRARSQKKTYVI